MERILSSIRANLPFTLVSSFLRKPISTREKADFSASSATMPVTASSFSRRSAKPSPNTLNSPLNWSMSVPTSVTVNLSFFLAGFFMVESNIAYIPGAVKLNLAVGDGGSD